MGMLAVLQLKQGQGQGAGGGRRHSAPGLKEDQITIGAVTPYASVSRSRLPDQDVADLRRDAERWRRGQEQERRLLQEEPRRTSPNTIRADQGGDSLIDREERRSTPASRAQSDSRSRRISEIRAGCDRITAEERRMKDDRKKYLRSNCPDTIMPEEGADQGLEQMRMFRWLQSMTEWMTEYESC